MHRENHPNLLISTLQSSNKTVEENQDIFNIKSEALLCYLVREIPICTLGTMKRYNPL